MNGFPNFIYGSYDATLLDSSESHSHYCEFRHSLKNCGGGGGTQQNYFPKN